MQNPLLLSVCLLVGLNLYSQEKEPFDFNHFEFIFQPDSTELDQELSQKLDQLVEFIYANPQALLNITLLKSELVSDSVGLKRYSLIQEYMVNKGLNFLHFELSVNNLNEHLKKPDRTNRHFYYNANQFVFDLAKEQVSPCDSMNSGTFIHFKTNSTQIVETECDSIIDFYRMTSKEKTTEWAIIGIAKNKTEDAREFALERANSVIDRLVEMGIEKSRLIPFANYHQEPEKGDSRDWPYYPLWYEYEIGVYIQVYL
jgi:outer membrane protein OmpA-like peptidoglycan-associated protein